MLWWCHEAVASLEHNRVSTGHSYEQGARAANHNRAVPAHPHLLGPLGVFSTKCLLKCNYAHANTTAMFLIITRDSFTADLDFH